MKSLIFLLFEFQLQRASIEIWHRLQIEGSRQTTLYSYGTPIRIGKVSIIIVIIIIIIIVIVLSILSWKVVHMELSNDPCRPRQGFTPAWVKMPSWSETTRDKL